MMATQKKAGKSVFLPRKKTNQMQNPILLYLLILIFVLGKESCESPMKKIKAVLPAPSPHWVGDGFKVRSLFHNLAFTQEISPFLMFDYADPKHFNPTLKQPGVGQHPHRGFETVTLAFQGEVEHGDSRGNRGVITEGGVQWMTAGSGIIHEEFHSKSFAKTGGTFEMMQLWVNLPAKDKMTVPKYQGINSEDIPVVSVDGASVRVIAGDFHGTRGPATTFTPIDLWDIRLEEGIPVRFSVQESHNCILFVRTGKVRCGTKNLETHQVALMTVEGNTFQLEATEPGSSVVLLSGEVIDEPIAARGPFVMNTQKELSQAISDFQSGKMGQHF